MKISKLYFLIALLISAACTDSEPEIEINDENFPFRFQYGSVEGADLADAEDYDVDIEFGETSLMSKLYLTIRFQEKETFQVFQSTRLFTNMKVR